MVMRVLFQTDTPPVAAEEHPPTPCCAFCLGQKMTKIAVLLK